SMSTEKVNTIWGTYDADPATGLPAMPEGQFWRVKHARDSSYVHLQLRERRRFGSRLLSWTTISKKHKLSEKAVREAAAYIVHCEPDRENKLTRHDLIGDYPPKTIKEEA